MKANKMLTMVLVAVALMGFMACQPMVDPLPEPVVVQPEPVPDPVKTVVAGVQFTKVYGLSTTGIYQWDGSGTYYTVTGDVAVAALDQYTITIDGETFVNDQYRDASRNGGEHAFSITTKYWVKDGRKWWLGTDPVYYADQLVWWMGSEEDTYFESIHAPTDLTGYVESD